MSEIKVNPNSNFTSIGGSVTPENVSEEYIEYRKVSAYKR